MALPNFFCLGTQKAGTTTLHNILCQHPDIFLPPNKETWFFHMDEEYARGLAWYEAEYFNDCHKAHAVGEITPEYMYFETVAERIYQSLGPKTKLIFSLRNPADRAYSHYLMTHRRAREELSFEDAIAAEPQRISSGFQNKIDYSYISRGIYASQIQRFLNFFPKENMLFLVFEEDIAKEMDNTIKRILSFLDVEYVSLNKNIVSNRASAPRIPFIRNIIFKPNNFRKFFKLLVPFSEGRSWLRHTLDNWNQVPLQNKSLDKKLRAHLLAKYFQNDIKQLENIIGRSLGVWYKDPLKG